MSNEKKSSYKNLFSNTLIFALGSFSSKILIILLVNVYTTYLTQAEMGINDVIQQIANWLSPIVTMTVSESVIRFGLDKAYDKKQVFSIANLACAAGLTLLAIVLPIVNASGIADEYIHGYALLLFFYILAASMKLVYSNFLRALEKVKLYAVNSILTTLLTLIGTVLFICIFKMGNVGYLLSIILSDALSTVFMLIAAKLWRYYDFKAIDKTMIKRMLSYCLPLIPAQLMWLVTNSSDSFMTTHYMGSDANGILSASYKIANLVSTVYLMFGQAWNMSAILEDDSDDRNEFYSNVFHLNQCLLYILAAGCIMICQPLTEIWMGESFHDSAKYAPILIYSTIFSCFTTFMGSIYLASNKTGRSMFTSMIAGVINVGINMVFIPRIGLYAPALSTVAAYLVVFIVRAYDSRKLVPFNLRVGKIIVNCTLLLIMTVISVTHYTGAPKHLSYIALPVMFVVIFAMNIKPVWSAAMHLLPKKITAIIERIGVKRLIAAGAAALVYLVVCYFFRTVLVVSMLIVFSALSAYGVTAKKNRIKWIGGTGLFVTIWAAFHIGCAFLALLVLLSIDYLKKADGFTAFAGCICFIAEIGSIFGTLAGIFTGLVVLAIAVAVNCRTVTKLILKLTSRKAK